MKQCIGALCLVLLLSGTVSASWNKSTETATVEKLMSNYEITEGKFAFGLDLMTVSSVQRDLALGYPHCAIGGNLGLGIMWRKYSGHPSSDKVANTAAYILERSPDITMGDLAQSVKDELGHKWFRYG